MVDTELSLTRTWLVCSLTLIRQISYLECLFTPCLYKFEIFFIVRLLNYISSRSFIAKDRLILLQLLAV